MPSVSDLLTQLFSNPASSDMVKPSIGTSTEIGITVDQNSMLKQAEVDAAAARKKEELAGTSLSSMGAYGLGITSSTGYGARSAGQLDKDMLTRNPGELMSKYGAEVALRLLTQKASGEDSYNIDRGMPVSTGENISDFAINTGISAINAVGGAGAWAGSLINDKLGTTLSGSLDAFNNAASSLTSDRSKSSKQINSTTNWLDTRDNEAQYQKDKTNGDILAVLKREGRNAIGAVNIAKSDPTTLLEGTASGIGSMLGFGYFNKAVQGIGGTGKVATMIRDASLPIAGGLVGGGSIYQQNVSDIMAKSTEEMAQQSPQYNKYVAQGLSPKDAQIRVAAESGEYAASIAGPLDMMTTMMVPGVNEIPHHVGSVGEAFKHTLFEPVQEFIESSNEQFASNAGNQYKFNPNQDIAEGVGKAAGTGALYGLTSAGATHAPGVAILGAKATKDAAATLLGSLKDKVSSISADNENSSPVSNAALATKATTAATQTPIVAANMQAAAANSDPAMQARVANFTNIMQSVSTHDANDFAESSDSIKAALSGATTKIDELNALKSVFNNKDSTDSDKDFAGTKLIDELSSMNEFLNTQTDVIDAVQDEPTKKFVRGMKQFAADILSNKEFLATRNDIATRLAQKHETSHPELAIAADPTSQEGKQAIAETLAIASTLPTEVNGKAVDAILKHSEDGSIKLTQEQKDNLEVSKAAITALQDNLVDGSDLMRVSTEASSAGLAGDKGKSAIQHATDIVRTVSEGNIPLAKTLLKSFERFAQHYQNKAEAVNQATQEGNDQDYKAHYTQLAHGQWVENKALYTFQKSGKGVELATQVHKEARAIGSMYNAIASMYPNMGVEPIALTKPDSIFLPGGKFDHKATQHGIGGNGLAGITAYRNRLVTQQSKGAENGHGQKEEVLIAPGTPSLPTRPPVRADGTESIEKVFHTDRVEAAAQLHERKLGVEKDLRNALTKPQPNEVGSLYGALRGMLSPESFKNDLGGNPKFNFLRSIKGNSLRNLIENGSYLDSFLTSRMTLNKGENLEAAVEHIVDKLNSGNYLTQQLQDRLDQLGITLQQINEAISDEQLDQEIAALEKRIADEAATAKSKKSARPAKGSEAGQTGTQKTIFESDEQSNKIAPVTVAPTINATKLEVTQAEYDKAISLQSMTGETAHDALDSASKKTLKILDTLENNPDSVAITTDATPTATTASIDKINIWYGSSENASLSNLAARKFTLLGKEYFSVEHAYQTLKSGSFDERTYARYKNAGVKISGKQAKIEGDYNISLMKRLMLASFNQNKEAKDLLLATGNAEITHTQEQGKSKWATIFPRLLMEVRNELRATPNATAPDTALTSSKPSTGPTQVTPTTQVSPPAIVSPTVNPISDAELSKLNLFLAAKSRLTEIITNPATYDPKIVAAAKKELSGLTKDRLNKVDYLFDGFPSDKAELDFLSNAPPSLIADTPGKLERLWELRNKSGKLFANLGTSKLLSTAGNILIAGTKPVNEKRASQLTDRPLDTFVQIVNENTNIKSDDKKLRTGLAKYITLRANLLQLAVSRTVLNEANSDNNLIKLLQLDHLDSLGNSNKYRIDLFPQNRLFSLLAPVDEGDTPKVKLDPRLMETASLAFMQWMLGAVDRKAVVDEKTVAGILGIDENLVTEAQIAEYSERITNIEAIDAISAGILRHWGLKPKDNIQIGYSEGVTRVLAKEMLDAAVSKELIEAGFGLNHNQVRIDSNKTVDSYGIDKLPKNVKLANAIFPDLVDNTAFLKNDQVMYIGDVTVPTSKTILREPEQLLSPEQIRAQDNNQKTIHRIDEASYKLFMGIGVKGIFDILSLPEKTDLLNIGHAKSVIGKKQGISAVFNKMKEVYQRVSNLATDGDVHGVPIHYKFEYTSTNRLQMIGSHTPQASKWMRNVILPTNGTIDATYGKMGYTSFMLSVAQNLGVSIQNYSREANISKIATKLDGELADVVSLLKDRVINNEDRVSPKLIEALKSALGSEFTPSSLYALHEYARYLASSEADKANFKTGLYIEADGVNNGPASALMMLGGTSELTHEFFTNAARIGYFIGSDDRTLNQQRQEDPTGLYEAGAQVLPTFLADFGNKIDGHIIPEGENTPAIDLGAYFDQVKYVVASLLPNFSMDENGNYTIGRSVIKNPLTKTVYGSGSRGMGNGLLKDMLNAFYEKLSIVKLYEDWYSSEGKSNPRESAFVEVFGDQYRELIKSMHRLASHSVEVEKKQFVVKNGISPQNKFFVENDYLNFEVSGTAFNSMSNNINTFFSKKVRSAITDVMSEAVMDSTQLLAKATSFHTEFMSHEFNKLYEAALAKRKNSDHLYRQADGLSNDELRAITNKMSKTFPYIKTTTQSFNPVGASKISSDNFIGVTSTGYKVTPSIFVPESAGVSGIPYMIIGLGDGRTIQIFSDGGPEDTLNIYDGIHMGLGKVEEYSKRANSAVWDSWQGNPFGALFPSLSTFVTNYDWPTFLASAKSDKLKIAPILAALHIKSVSELPNYIANLINNVSTSAKNIDATHQVLGKYKATIDQLASIGSPYVKSGADIIIDDASIADINSKISSIAQADTNYAVNGILSDVAAKFNVPTPTKPTEYSLKSFIATGSVANKTTTVESLLSTKLLDNVSVKYGPLSSFSDKLTKDDFGGYDPKTNTIYIASDKSGGVETLTHEMVHAATFRAIANHYANPGNSVIATEVSRLETLMGSFLNRAALSIDDTVSGIADKINKIGDSSIKLNEFMAYGLSNPAMRADLTSATALKLPENIINKYTGKIKQLIKDILTKLGVQAQKTEYDQLVFNAVHVMASGDNATMSNGQILKMAIGGLNTNNRLNKVTEFFASSLDKYLDSQIDPAFSRLPPTGLLTKNPGEFTRADRLGFQVSTLIASKFNTSPQEKVALDMIVSTLATGAKLDGNIMSGIEQLYTHFTKNLTPEDFLLVAPTDATQADTYEANEMYNLVMGNYTTAKDVYGRGQTLPIFFSLGLVNDRFRDVLSKKGLPEAIKVISSDTDAFLTSSANFLLDKMDKALIGTAKSKNTQQALDSIFSTLVQTGTDSLTLVGAGLNKTGSMVDGINDRVVSAIEYVSAKLNDSADKKLATTSNKVVKGVANVAKNIALSINEDTAARVGEFAVSLSNQSNLFKPLQSLITDFVGRTDSNKLLYDMIKFVRSNAQKDRQHYREELPAILASQFTRKLSDKEWTHLFTGLAKTDLAQLVNSIGIKDTVSLLSDPTKIDTRITTLEANLRNQVPSSWPSIQKKSKQLANYMMTGEHGPMLMRNADIIQLTLGGNRNEIDSLVTLYALQKLEQPVKTTLTSLVQTQKSGIDSLVGYLSGQRQDDIHPDAAIRMNVYKGYIPSLQNESVSLKVMPNTEHAAMLEKGYIRTGNYAGSILETRASSSYYFLNAPAKAAFSQGLIQNVHSTSGGIDTRTLFSTGLVAGRIVDPRVVSKLAPYLNGDVAGNENLLPIFDGTGNIIALERAVRPDQLVQLKQDTHLAKMIGVWRGRQVEEYKSRAVNEALISRFKQMYSDDISKNPNTAREYVNLFQSQDPIHKDALKLMPIYMKRALESEFGKDTFMVRKDMIDSTIGYRTPSIGDAWTGVSGWSPKSLELAKNVTMSIFGNKSYEYLVNAEQILKNAIQDVKLIIVVKSVIVPVGNMLANVIQLMSRGVPINDIVRGMPKKVSEVTFYNKQHLRKIELEVALRVAEGNNDIVGIRKAKNELETIEDSFRRLSIWPLIHAGEFSAISDAGISRDDIILSEGRLHTYIENLTNKLPDGVRTAAKYGLVAKDTALFQGLQKAVEYGDFLAKAIQYDYLTTNKKLSKEDSLARISEEFVNYDLLMGRFREYMENIGLLWFTAFKVRSTKIAASIIRNNPFHALMSSIPHSFMPSGTGTPITDNAVAKTMTGSIWYSLGFGQALRAPQLNPWFNLAY